MSVLKLTIKYEKRKKLFTINLNYNIMEIEKMSIDEKREALIGWINDLDEWSLDQLLIECFGL